MKRFKGCVTILLILSIVLAFAACNKTKITLSTPEGLYLDENFTLSWRDVEGARGYEVEITNVASDAAPAVQKVTRASVSLSRLSAGDYSVRVRAFGGANRDEYSQYTIPYTFSRDLESGLVYTLSANGAEYSVTSLGTASGNVVIEDFYHGRPVTSVGASAFRGRSSVTGVTVGANVKNIESNAFFNCVNMTYIDLPEGLLTIGESAFQSCISLLEVDIPAGVKTLNKLCFGYCRGLTKITFHEGLLEVGESAFYECNSIEELTLPDSLMYIGANAFTSTTSLKSVSFGDGIQYIGFRAFDEKKATEGNGDGITEVTFKDTKDPFYIAEYAFTNCAFSSIALPQGTAMIGFAAFMDCANLQNVDIPSSVKSVGSDAFYGTAVYNSQLEEGDQYDDGMIYVDDWLVAVTDKVAENVRFLKGENDPVRTTEDADGDNIPDNWKLDNFHDKDEGETVFRNYYTIKDNIVGIADSTFARYDQKDPSDGHVLNPPTLRYFIVPNSVKYIGAGAFLNQSNLYNLECNDVSQLEIIGSEAFENCKALQSLSFKSSLREIGNSAFANCNGLSQVSLSDGLKYIGSGAFSGCSALNNSVIDPTALTPKSLERIGAFAFYETGIWENAQGSGGLVVAGNWIVGYDESGGRWEFDGSLDDYEITGIADYALYNCELLQSIDISNVTKIGRSAFSGCTGLISVTLNDGLTEIPEFAFYGCTSLNMPDMPADLQSIGRYAFFNTALQSVTLVLQPLTFIGDHAFYGCENMTQLLLPSTLTSIEPYTFYGCRLLERVDIPSSVQTIGERAFGKCESLANVTFGSGLQEIGEYAFRDCAKLEAVDLENVKTVGSHAFYNCSAIRTLGLGNVEAIGDYAFANSDIREFWLPETIKTIGDGAFRGCGNMAVAYFEGTPEQVGANAFGDCTRLTIYAKCVNSDTESWSVLWNDSFRPVFYGCEFENGMLKSVTGETQYIQAYMGISEPRSDDMVFAGWATSEDATDAEFGMEGLSSVQPSVRLYVVWTQKPAEPEEPSNA